MSFLSKPSEIVLEKTYSMIVYGEPGIGKTTTALSASKPCLINLDASIKRVDSDFWVPTLQAKKYEEIIGLINSKEINEFDTIVIDPFADLIELMIAHLSEKFPKIQSGNTLTQRGWGEVKAEFKNFWRIIKSKEKSLIITAHEKSETVADTSYFVPDVGRGSSGKELMKFLDIVARMSRIGGKVAMFFEASDSQFYAKNSYNFPSHVLIPNPSVAHKNTFIKDVIEKKVIERKEKAENFSREFEQILSKICDKIDSMNEIGYCNALYNELKDEKRVNWKDHFAEKCKQLGFTFDTAKKVFVCSK